MGQAPRSSGPSAFRSIKAAARELCLSELTVRRAITDGSIPAVQIHGNWRIPGSYFDELEQQAYGRLILSGSKNPRLPKRTALSWTDSAASASVNVLRSGVAVRDARSVAGTE